MQVNEDNPSLQNPLLEDDPDIVVNVKEKKPEKRKTDFRSSRRKLIALTFPHMKWLVAGCLVLLIRLPFSLAMPHWVATTIGALISHRGKAAVIRLVVILFVCGSIDALLDFWCVFLFAYTQQNIIKDLRLRLFSTLLQQEVSFFDSVKSGDLNSRLNADCGIMASDLTTVFRFTIESVVRICGISVYMFFFEPRLALVAVSVIPVCAAVNRIYAGWMSRNADLVQEALAAANATAQEVLSSVTTVFSFAGQDLESERYKSNINRHFKLNVRQAKITAVYYMLCNTFLVNTCVQAGLLLYGAKLCDWGSAESEGKPGVMKPSTLVAFMLYQSQLQEYFQNLFSSYTSLVKSTGTGHRVFYLLDRKPSTIYLEDLEETKTTEELRTNSKGHVVMDNVTFFYEKYSSKLDIDKDSSDEEEEVQVSAVLKNFNLIANPGQTIALVGRSGAGKSTALSLLKRHYQPKSGSIYLDGIDINGSLTRMPGWLLHSKIAIVGQEPVLMSGSIKDNILYGIRSLSLARNKALSETGSGPFHCSGNNRLFSFIKRFEAGEEQFVNGAVENAAKIANAATFIEELPKKYMTEVGEKGVRLSGGQKQRIAIARALLMNPVVLLLDEATSALDADSEGAVQKALQQAMRGRTTIVVAHRLSTVVNADVIIVLDRGRAVQIGTHSELVAQGKWHKGMSSSEYPEPFMTYAELVERQQILNS
eukprot:g2512.t1